MKQCWLVAILVGCGVLSVHGSATAGCAVSNTLAPYSNFRNIKVSWSANFSTFASAAQGGMNIWNSACNGASGGTYPSFTTVDDYSSLGLFINYLPFDHAPSTSDACGGYCRGFFNTGTLTITIYGYSGPPGGLTAWSSLSPSVRSALLAHEFGHALGLADDTCSGAIMNVPVSGIEGVSADECSMADQMNYVPHEGTSLQGCDNAADCHQSPIVINLEDGGYRLTDLEGGVWFDLNGDGTLNRVSWTAAGAEEGFLFLDRNENGQVDDGWELFGNLAAVNGFETLRVFDRPNTGDVLYGGNGDGWLDASDAIWSHLRLWIDYNHDGVTQVNEVFTLPQKGVVAIGLDYTESRRRDANGNLFRYGAPILLERHGHLVTRRVYDIFFALQP